MASRVPKLLFVGAGSIAQSIMRGILQSRPDAAEQILATAPTSRNLDNIRESLGCRISLLKDVRGLIREFQPEFVLVCVKPQVLLSCIKKCDTLTQVLKSIPHNCTTLSLLAGIRSQVFVSAFNMPERSVVRVMLNTAAEMRATSVFYHPHPSLEASTAGQLEELFSLVGRPVIRLNEESQMDVATGVCGSGIAFFYEVIQALSDVGVKNGLARSDALEVAAQLSRSAGEMLLRKRGAHPYELRDAISSPAGTTIYGLDKWHEQSTSRSIQKSVQASIERARELSNESARSNLDDDQMPGML